MSQSICCPGSSRMTRWSGCVRPCPSPCAHAARTGALHGHNKHKYRDDIKVWIQTQTTEKSQHYMCFVTFHPSNNVLTRSLRWHMSGWSELCVLITEACVAPALTALRRQSLSRAANKQPNKTENLIPAFHFQSVLLYDLLVFISPA